MNIGVNVIGHPVGYPGSHRSGFESVPVSRTEGRDVTSLAPSHDSNEVFVHKTFFDKMIDATNHVFVISNTQVSVIQLSEVSPVAFAAPVIRLKYEHSFGHKLLHRIVAARDHRR